MSSEHSAELHSWLFGKWKGKGSGSYPTITPFEYLEEVEFCNNGAPFTYYKANSFDVQHGKPMHCESGFLRMKPDSETVALMLAHNFGIAEVLEGETSNSKELHLKSSRQTILRMQSFSNSPHVIETKRIYKSLEHDKMELKLFMATEDQPLQLHLHIIYDRVNEAAAQT